MVIIDVQRAGPSTGMPTKTEQSDLLQALYGRHGESPLPVLASSSPGPVLRGGLRGGADRGHLPHAGDPAERPVRRQLERAVEDPVGVGRCRRSTRASARAAAKGAVPARTRATTTWRGRGRSRARPGWRTGSAGWRSSTARARSPTTARTTADDRAARGQGGRASRCPTSRSTATPTPTCWCSAGARPTGRSARARGGCARAAGASPRRTCATCSPMPANTRRGAALVRAGAGAGDEQRASSPTSCAPATWSTSSRTRRCRASRCCRRRWSARYGSA